MRFLVGGSVKMKRRAASPAASENELDILDALVNHDSNANGERGGFPELDFDDLLGRKHPKAQQNGGTAEDDGDEAFIALQQAASFRKTAQATSSSKKFGGGFQKMGLNPHLLRAITRKGFSVPTPIQRKTIPLILDRKDVVGMARTGSGKTAAFVIPMIERLRAHSAQFGARALVLSPSRELALQTLKVVKELARGTDLKCVLLHGGDSMEDNFALMASNPDIVVAAPGRFLHVKMEMGLSLASVQYVVLDEADRLFEGELASQVTEIMASLALSRQTLLFSATLPSTLVEFAKAGLQDPVLVRLDVESSLSPELESAFFSVKGQDKEGALLHILKEAIKMPLGRPEGAKPEVTEERPSKRRKRDSDTPRQKEKPSEHSTIIFAATKHHVEYLAALLQRYGFAVSYVYGSLDQTARSLQVEDFRRGRSNILVVTDVAARGIDIPVLANVINYDFPLPKVYIHRVGRTARANQRGWSWSLVRDTDAPYLVDLQLLLGKRLVVGREGVEASYTEDMIAGALPRSQVEPNVEWVSKTLSDSADMAALRSVVDKAEKLYLRSRSAASSQSAKRAKELTTSKAWTQLHALFSSSEDADEDARTEMLAKIGGFKPQETIFEVGDKGKAQSNEAAEVMRTFRARVGPRRAVRADAKELVNVGPRQPNAGSEDSEDEEALSPNADGQNEHSNGQGLFESESDDVFDVQVSESAQPRDASSWQDAEIYMSYTPRSINTAAERGLGLENSSQNQRGFIEAARDAAMDLHNDEVAKSFGVPTRVDRRWDKKAKKYVSTANDEDGSRRGKARMIRGESGAKIPASMQSGHFDRWQRDNRYRIPRVGEAEKQMPNLPTAGNNFRFKHKMIKAPKEADKFRDDYYKQKKRVKEAEEKRVGRFKDGPGSSRELKNAQDIAKARKQKDLRQAKNARPAKRGGKR
jgi:ATP-dependent RNA helicase DDX54/DBP10